MYAWLSERTTPRVALILTVFWYALLLMLIALLAAGVPQAEFRYGVI